MAGTADSCTSHFLTCPKVCTVRYTWPAGQLVASQEPRPNLMSDGSRAPKPPGCWPVWRLVVCTDASDEREKKKKKPRSYGGIGDSTSQSTLHYTALHGTAHSLHTSSQTSDSKFGLGPYGKMSQNSISDPVWPCPPGRPAPGLAPGSLELPVGTAMHSTTWTLFDSSDKRYPNDDFLHCLTILLLACKFSPASGYHLVAL